MKKDIRFVKLANRWFALFPLFNDGDVEDLEMVGNASIFLDHIYNRRSKGGGIISLVVSDEEIEDADFVLTLKGDDTVFGECGKNYDVTYARFETVSNIWLCPVLRWFFCGEYPEKIYVKLAW